MDIMPDSNQSIISGPQLTDIHEMQALECTVGAALAVWRFECNWKTLNKQATEKCVHYRLGHALNHNISDRKKILDIPA